MAHDEAQAKASRQGARAAASEPTSETAGAELLEQLAPERVERYARFLPLLAKSEVFGDRTRYSRAAAALAMRDGDEGAVAAACVAEARAWRRTKGFWHRLRIGLSPVEATTVVARRDAGAPPLSAVADEVLELERARLARECRSPTLAAQLLAAQPDAEARRAWYARVLAAWKELRRLRAFVPRHAQRLLFWLVRDPSVDVAERMKTVERIYLQLRTARAGSAGGLLLCAVVLAAGSTGPADEGRLVAQVAELKRRMKRHRTGRDWVESEAILGLLALASTDLDVLVGAILALRARAKASKVREIPAFTILQLLQHITGDRPRLRELLDGYADVLMLQIMEAQAAAVAAAV